MIMQTSMKTRGRKEECYMKGFTKKVMVGAVAASMVMSSSLVAFAEDPSPTPAGTGTSKIGRAHV